MGGVPLSAPDPTFVLVELAMRGVDASVVDGQLRLRNASRLSPELAEQIREVKPALIELLNEQGGEIAPVRETAPSWPSANVACLSCGKALFVRLRNGRRSVCLICEKPKHEDILGADGGIVGACGDDGGDA